MSQGYAVICNKIGYFEICGHVPGTCHSSYALYKGSKKTLDQSLKKYLSSFVEFAKITFFRHVQTLEDLVGNARDVFMVSGRWKLI